MSTQFEFDGLSLNNPADADLLKNIQGGILKSHGRDYVGLLCLSFSPSPDAFVALRTLLASVQPTSEFDNIQERSGAGAGGDSVFCGLYFSADFLYWTFPTKQLPQDLRFRRSMRRSSVHILNDEPISSWEPHLQQPAIIILLAANDEDALNKTCLAVQAQAEACLGPDLLSVLEKGRGTKDNIGRPTEPFGFVDGISQPFFFDWEMERYKTATGGNFSWDPSADPFKLVLSRDPYTPGGLGSYLVYRKIAQHKVAFDQFCNTATVSAGNETVDLGAMLVGRTKDGSPLVPAEGENDFDLTTDPDGLACPHFAHIRKCNPRNVVPDSRCHRIIRRGIPYGAPGEEQGLQFLAFQKDIASQFEFIQANWANNVKANGRDMESGRDPLIGNAPRNEASVPLRQAVDDRAIYPPKLTTLKGGGYFFAPSIPTLAQWRA